MSIRKVIFVVFCNIIIFLCLIFIAEFISSMLVARPNENVLQDYYLNHVWRPNYQQVHDEFTDNPDFPTPYIHYYNSQGWLESYDVSTDKNNGTYRIFYMGDSFTEGTCHMDQSVPSIVERELNKLSSGTNFNFEVINTGTTSYSPTLIYLMLRHKLLNFKPDLIVVNVDMTDDFDEWKYSQTLIVDEDGNPYADPPRNIFMSDYLDTEHGNIKATYYNKAIVYLSQNSYTYNLLMKINENRLESQFEKYINRRLVEDYNGIFQRWAWCQMEWSKSTVRNVDYTLNMLKKIYVLCSKNNIKLMLTSVPHYQQYLDTPWGGGAKIHLSGQVGLTM